MRFFFAKPNYINMHQSAKEDKYRGDIYKSESQEKRRKRPKTKAKTVPDGEKQK